jgi:hypothetical protein
MGPNKRFIEEVELLGDLLSDAWTSFAEKTGDAEAALVAMLVMAMKNLYAIGYTSKEIESLWQVVITNPKTIELAEQVQGMVQARAANAHNNKNWGIN